MPWDSPALRLAKVEVRLLKSLCADQKHARCEEDVERDGFDIVVVKNYVVPLSNASIGLSLWIADKTGETSDQVIDRLGAEATQRSDWL